LGPPAVTRGGSLRDGFEVEAAGVPVAGVLTVSVDLDAELLVADEVVVAVGAVGDGDAGDAVAGRADRR
jgi:hypothetical protein